MGRTGAATGAATTARAGAAATAAPTNADERAAQVATPGRRGVRAAPAQDTKAAMAARVTGGHKRSNGETPQRDKFNAEMGWVRQKRSDRRRARLYEADRRGGGGACDGRYVRLNGCSGRRRRMLDLPSTAGAAGDWLLPCEDLGQLVSWSSAMRHICFGT